jgi:hypothetical protein
MIMNRQSSMVGHKNGCGMLGCLCVCVSVCMCVCICVHVCVSPICVCMCQFAISRVGAGSLIAHRVSLIKGSPDAHAVMSLKLKILI